MSAKSLYGGRNLKETLLYLVGVASAIFGVIMIGGVIVGDSESSDWVALPVFLVIFWGPAILAIYKSNASRRRRIEVVKDELFGKIIRLAEVRGGKLYLNDVVTDLNVPLSHAESLMEELSIKYSETVDTEVEETGMIAYIFPSSN
jgi:hypothetical protein